VVLLGVPTEWPCRRTTQERDELAPFYSITSSARASKDCGTDKPSAFPSLHSFAPRAEAFIG
jgi:hypothetical protein